MDGQPAQPLHPCPALLRKGRVGRVLQGLFFTGLLLLVVAASPSCATRPSATADAAQDSEAPRVAKPALVEPTESGTGTESGTETPSGIPETGVAATPEPAPARSETARKADAWKPPEPGKDQFDWIRLKSGEWLKGEIKYLRNRKLEFDSDELDELTFDWDDVVEVRSPRPNTILLEEKVQKSGTLLIRDGVVVVGGEEPWTYPRSQLVSIVPGEEKESDYWSGDLSIGVTFRSGNTDQTDITARGTVWRQTALTRTTLDYTGSITTLDGREEVNNHRIFTSYSVFLTTRFYVTPGALEYYKDRISNIRHRITPGAGAGYWVVDSPEIDWNVDLLGGYRYTEYETVEAGQDRTEETGALIASTTFDWEVTNDIDLLLEYRIDLGLNRAASTNHHAATTLSVDLTKLLDLNVSFIWDRIGDPRPDDNGDVPKKDDFRLVIGFGLDF